MFITQKFNAAQEESDYPSCPSCGAEMRLLSAMPDELGAERRQFLCGSCQAALAKVVPTGLPFHMI